MSRLIPVVRRLIDPHFNVHFLVVDLEDDCSWLHFSQRQRDFIQIDVTVLNDFHLLRVKGFDQYVKQADGDVDANITVFAGFVLDQQVNHFGCGFDYFSQMGFYTRLVLPG